MRRALLAATILAQPFAPSIAQTPPPPPVQPSAAAVCSSIPSVQTLLPCGPLHVVRSQTVDQQNRPVKLTCAAWWGGLPNPPQQVLTMGLAGFNCVRISYFNRTIDNDLAMIDDAVKVMAPVGIRIIVNAHANEGNGNCVAQQGNGLWFDKGPGTDGTDGCGTSGQVDDAKWVSDWAKVAAHFKGNDTIVGYDLDNEPTLGIGGQGSEWGTGSVRDIRLAYQRAGNAIQAVDPTKLIIAEGIQNYGAGAPEGDLRPVATQPVVLNTPNMVVYSVHEYPASIGGAPVQDGPAYVQQMNAAWGYLITQDIAPVWIGEMGASLIDHRDAAWAATLVSYLSGKAPGGVVIPAGGQAPGTDWWMWDHCDYEPNGALEADRITPRVDIANIYGQFLQHAIGDAIGALTATSTAYAQQITNLSAVAFPQQSPAAQPTDTPAAVTAAPVTDAQIDPTNSTGILNAQQDSNNADAIVARTNAMLAAQATGGTQAATQVASGGARADAAPVLTVAAPAPHHACCNRKPDYRPVGGQHL